MEKVTTGTVIAIAKQWWLKINRKPIRRHFLDGAEFPSIIKVTYKVNGQEYIKRKWINAGKTVPTVGSSIQVAYNDEKPQKAKILL